MFHCPICGRLLQGGIMAGHHCSRRYLDERERLYRRLEDEDVEQPEPQEQNIADVIDSLEDNYDNR